MKLLSALLATFLYSTSAHAALEFTFSGDFVNFSTGNFSGQLTVEVLPPQNGSDFLYSLRAPSSLLVNNQPFDINIDEDKFLINIIDNLTISEAEISNRGFTNEHIKPGTYDFLAAHLESVGTLYEDGLLKSGAEFSVLAFFDPNVLDASDLENPNYQGLFGLPAPIYSVFEIRKLSNSEDVRGAGVITASDIVDTHVFTPVPLPGAVWLFGSVIAGLGLRMRKQA